ncbi:MAG TPA: prolipoprotein diacylglyceryl transferase [Candidatus Doudnabacteria bacterium]|nr:prolipoprotein diacylglyceryl transferase [Candidatus Doudnabacteria bacterium]
MKRSAWLLVGLIFIIMGWLLFGKIFPGQIILPQNLQIAGLTIQYYGLILGVAIVAGYTLAYYRAPEFGVPRDKVDNLVLVLLLGGFIGARLYHVYSSWDYYVANQGQIIMVWQGGLSIFGAILGGAVALLLIRKLFGLTLRYAELLDWLAPSVVLGHLIGRFGNLFNYEAYGWPTTLPWKMYVPSQFRLSPYFSEQYFHPLFLYEAIAGLLILVILLNFSRLTQKRPWLRFSGSSFWLWLGLYGLVRFCTEILRIDSPYFGSIKQNMVASGLMLVFAGIVFFKHYRARRANHEPLLS